MPSLRIVISMLLRSPKFSTTCGVLISFHSLSLRTHLMYQNTFQGNRILNYVEFLSTHILAKERTIPQKRSPSLRSLKIFASLCYQRMGNVAFDISIHSSSQLTASLAAIAYFSDIGMAFKSVGKILTRIFEIFLGKSRLE